VPLRLSENFWLDICAPVCYPEYVRVHECMCPLNTSEKPLRKKTWQYRFDLILLLLNWLRNPLESQWSRSDQLTIGRGDAPTLPPSDLWSSEKGLGRLSTHVRPCEFGDSTAGCHGERNISKETQEWEQATHSPLLKPSEKGTMAAKRFKDSYEVVRIKTEKKDFSKSITPQERFLERSEKPQRNLRKVRDVVEINGKKYYVM